MLVVPPRGVATAGSLYCAADINIIIINFWD
jgi:hypothetical protein